MSGIEEIKRGLSRAWDSVAEGWRELTQRASEAITRFNPVHRSDEQDLEQRQLLAASSRWGVLAAEVRLEDDAVKVSLEVPGMDPDDFRIDVVDDLLVVRGEKRIERRTERGQYHVLERAYGSFERAIALPVAVDENHASANYERGVLHLSLPRAAHTRARKIPVRGAS
ncbi:MAG: Hsp20/alpha crystallin family protein [Proteobacteria bacterium]|nr:Hsp20/alpha crystallin family protein [Pseudomonadota bacterium]